MGFTALNIKIMEYYVSVTETLNRVVKVEASNEAEAEKKALKAYAAGRIVLSPDDYADTDITCEQDQTFYLQNEQHGGIAYQKIQ